MLFRSRSSALAATPACRLDPATLPIPSPNGSPLVGRVCKVNNSAPPASLLSEASMLPCPVLMVSAEPYLLFPVITGNSGPGNPLPPAPPQFLPFSLHHACSEIPVFHSSYIHSSHCNKVSSNNKNHAFCYQRKGIFILCVCCVCCVCFICAI